MRPVKHFVPINTNTIFILSEDRVKKTQSCAAGIPWSADIALNDTRVPDAGTYRCMVTNPPEAADPGIGELELSVLGECVTGCHVLWA